MLYHTTKSGALMTINHFLNEFKQKSDNITFLSIQHFLMKLYKDGDEVTDIEETLSNYPLYLKYLNDFAGKIYKQYDSSIDEIYANTCHIMNIEPDNRYLFNYRLARLELNDIARIMNIQNEDIKIQTVEKQFDEFQKLLNSKFYQENQETYKAKIVRLEKNFELLKQLFN